MDEVEELDASADAAENDRAVAEARVYTDYKMFQHALRHLEAVLYRDPNHAGALALQSEIKELLWSAGETPPAPAAKPAAKTSAARLDAMLSGLTRLSTRGKPKS